MKKTRNFESTARCYNRPLSRSTQGQFEDHVLKVDEKVYDIKPLKSNAQI